MNYSIGLTLRYFIFYKQTQNHTHVSAIYTTLSTKDKILFPASIGLLILLLLLSLLLPATFLCIYTHSQSLCFPSPPFSHRALLRLTSLTYFTHPSLTLFYSLSFTISTNSQKTLLSLVHTRFSSFHHSQKTNFSQSIIDHPSPWTTPRPFVTAVSLLKTTPVCPLSHYWLSVHRPRKNTVQLEILSCLWKVVLVGVPPGHCVKMERSAAVCFSPLLNFVAVRLDECQGHPQSESHSDIWRPGHGSLSPPWEVAVVLNGAQPSVSAPVAFGSAVRLRWVPRFMGQPPP